MPRICINAGHKVGMDPGVCGSHSTEAEQVLKYANIAADYLRKVGYQVLVLQENELYDICDKANRWVADLFVSIHCNGAVSTDAYGTEIFYYDGSANSEKLARCIYNQVEPILADARVKQRPESNEALVRDISNRGLKDGSAKGASLYVVKNTDAPAVLLETGFLSNRLDEELLTTMEDEIGAAIARGVSDYYA